MFQEMLPLEIKAKIVLNAMNGYNALYKSTVAVNLPYRKKRAELARQDAATRIGLVRVALDEGTFHNATLLNGLYNIDWNIELLWFLASFEIIDLPAYLNSREKDSEFTQFFASDIISLYTRDFSEFIQAVRGDMVIAISKLKEMKEDSTIVNLFVDQFYSYLKHTADMPSALSIITDFPNSSIPIANLLFEIMNRCMEGGMTSRKAMASDENYQPTTDPSIQQFITKTVEMTDTIPSHYLLKFLTNCTDQSAINWNCLALCVHLAIKKNPSAFNRMINDLLGYSLTTLSKWHLYATLLLGKICTLKSAESNVTFLQWFTATFSSDSSRPLDTVEKAKFFIKAMTDILEEEPVGYIKVYLHKMASVPPSAQSELSNYVRTARACLESKNVPLEIGFFETTSDCNHDDDVNRLIANYRLNKKLPESFISSINFRRKLFDQSLLPKLLTTCPGRHSDQHAVIKLLAASKKLSASIFSKHNEQCS